MLIFKKTTWLAVSLTVLLVAITGCASSDTEDADGQLIVLEDGRIYQLSHRGGDVYALITVSEAETRKRMDRINKVLGN